MGLLIACGIACTPACSKGSATAEQILEATASGLENPQAGEIEGLVREVASECTERMSNVCREGLKRAVRLPLDSPGQLLVEFHDAAEVRDTIGVAACLDYSDDARRRAASSLITAMLWEQEVEATTKLLLSKFGERAMEELKDPSAPEVWALDGKHPMAAEFVLGAGLIGSSNLNAIPDELKRLDASVYPNIGEEPIRFISKYRAEIWGPVQRPLDQDYITGLRFLCYNDVDGDKKWRLVPVGNPSIYSLYSPTEGRDLDNRTKSESRWWGLLKVAVLSKIAIGADSFATLRSQTTQFKAYIDHYARETANKLREASQGASEDPDVGAPWVFFPGRALGPR